jgi:membrane protein implicated in regulation of membrane protease activity
MSYRIEFLPGLILTGALLLVLLVPPIAVIAVIVFATAAVVALVALAGAVLATPYFVARFVHRRLADRHLATPTVPHTTEIHRTRLASLTELTPAGR